MKTICTRLRQSAKRESSPWGVCYIPRRSLHSRGLNLDSTDYNQQPKQVFRYEFQVGKREVTQWWARGQCRPSYGGSSFGCLRWNIASVLGRNLVRRRK